MLRDPGYSSSAVPEGDVEVDLLSKMSPAMRSYGHRITTEAKKVAIIGAGPSGLVAAKSVAAEYAGLGR